MNNTINMNNDFWNERYSTDEYIFGIEPNEYFKSKIAELKPGRILVPAAGEGRDAVYAATIGWDVIAFDLSEVGKNKALKLAALKNVKIHYDLYDVNDLTVLENEFDAVVISYFHLPENIRTEFLKKIIYSLKVGGVIILEAFNPKQLYNNSGGPNDLSLFLTTEILKNNFKELEIIENNEHEIILNEGDGHKGKASVVRFFGKKR